MDDGGEFSGLWYGFEYDDEPTEELTKGKELVEDSTPEELEEPEESEDYFINFGAKEGLGYYQAAGDYDYEATQRTSSAGNKMSEKEWMAMLRNPKDNSLNQLQFRVFIEEPFSDISDQERISIYFALRKFPYLEMRNIPLLVAAYLFRKQGNSLTKIDDFYQPFKPVFNKVDLIRYIRLVDIYIKK